VPTPALTSLTTIPLRFCRLRSAGVWISQENARVRQNYFCHEKDGEFSAEKIKDLPSGVAAMGDPSQMMNQQVLWQLWLPCFQHR
jgi:hypothetical protein